MIQYLINLRPFLIFYFNLQVLSENKTVKNFMPLKDKESKQ